MAVGEVANLASKFGHGDRWVGDRLVNDGRLDVRLINLLRGVVVLYFLSLSLDDWLDLFNDVLVDVLSDDGRVDRGRVGLIIDLLLVGVLALRLVLGGVVFRDVFLDVSVDVRSYVLVVSMVLLLVKHGLDLLMDLSLFPLPIDDGSDFVVSVLENIVVDDGVLDVSGVVSADLVVNAVL